MQPTEEQVKKFWEWCGFRQNLYQDTSGILYDTPDNLHCIGLPPIDLNNLFKYAVPKLHREQGQVTIESRFTGDVWEYHASFGCGSSGISKAETPELALFWAIWKVIPKENKE